MLGAVSPVKKIGNHLVRPNWRYDALFNPAKYKLKEFVCTTAVNGSGSLNRFLSLGLPYEVNNKMPNRVKSYHASLSPDNKSFFLAMWYRHVKRTGVKPVSIDADEGILQKVPLWNLKKLDKISDKYLVRLIKHQANYEYDSHIAYAMELCRNPDYAEVFKFIGYCIYAKVTDKAIATRWNIPVRHVEAVRMLFYDFSCFPKDRLATLAYLRQLTNIGLFTDVDFSYYKRVFELGELGLKAQTDFYGLDSTEKKLVEEYLGKSLISNTLNLNFSIKNQKDAIQYGAMVSNLASYYIKTSEVSYLDSKIRNLDAATRRIEGDLNSGDMLMTDIDRDLLALLSEHSLHDNRPVMKTLDMLD